MCHKRSRSTLELEQSLYRTNRVRQLRQQRDDCAGSPHGQRCGGRWIDRQGEGDLHRSYTGTVLAKGVPVAPVLNSSQPTGTADTIVTLSTGKFGSNPYLISEARHDSGKLVHEHTAARSRPWRHRGCGLSSVERGSPQRRGHDSPHDQYADVRGVARSKRLSYLE
jgi:hypothetical protein